MLKLKINTVLYDEIKKKKTNTNLDIKRKKKIYGLDCILYAIFFLLGW